MTASPGEVVTAAVGFLMAPGRAERVLAEHQDRGDGHCRCHTVHPATYPCDTTRLALAAIDQRALLIPIQRTQETHS